MSQAEIGNSPEVVPTPHQTEQAEHETEDLQQRLHNCDRKRAEAYLLLKQAQEELVRSESAIQEQNDRAKCFQDRIAQLESDLADKSEQLEQSTARCEFLRTHLKREQKQVSQLKALLERFLDGEERDDLVMSSEASASETARKSTYDDLGNLEDVVSLSQNITDTWVSSLSNEIEVNLSAETPDAVLTSTGKHFSRIDEIDEDEIDISELPEISISPVEQLANKLNLPLESRTSDTTEPSLPSLEAPAIEVPADRTFSQPIPNQNQISDYANHLILPQVTTPHFMQVLSKATKQAGPAPLIDRSRHRATNSFSAVKLPKFPPLQCR
ncbi:hypothetical protein [Pseudanabaena sp. PCC 6802]|uniref:hypothetical protein n=1 Tax=Pseudanabaena sp. PCC 6802 TaxID=118173 RepID=UPI0003458D04|nr:hypothetical protein [Pseudanabaena sp. PCC 6802]